MPRLRTKRKSIAMLLAVGADPRSTPTQKLRASEILLGVKRGRGRPPKEKPEEPVKAEPEPAPALGSEHHAGIWIGDPGAEGSTFIHNYNLAKLDRLVRMLTPED